MGETALLPADARAEGGEAVDEKQVTERIADMSSVLRSWCIARTDTLEDAEDLSQEILLTLWRSLPGLRDEKAFYGFMWSLAGNVYRAWLRKRLRRRECPLPETLEAPEPFPEDAPEDVALLRRELALLSRQHRQAAILYYVRGMRVAEIARRLDVSQSMVKYLLFKARIILKEGMGLERQYGQQSYHPRRLSLRYWGQGPNGYYGACDSLIRQNIVFACYNDQLTAEQIALEVGVGLPYMEDDLAALTEIGILIRDGRRYRTNIVIFTEDFAAEARQLIAEEVRRIAEEVKAAVTAQEAAIRAIGFTGCEMNSAAYTWQIASLLLHRAVINLAGDRAAPELPEDRRGVRCVTWGVDEADGRDAAFAFGASGANDHRGDWLRCMDFPVNGDMVHWYICTSPAVANVFFAIARGEALRSENDEAVAAELVRRGYARREGGTLAVNCPVYTAAQYTSLTELLAPAAERIAALALTMLEKEAALLQEHVPVHLRKTARQMAYFRLFEDAVERPMALLWADRFLSEGKAADLLPTTYIVLHG